MSSWREPRSRPVDECSPELIFELEWKKKAAKSSGKREEDIRARIGIWDPPDPTLDLSSFKSYLCQNLGLSGDVAVSYLDSDGDELPIDSECEFREALKYAKAQTKEYKNVLLMIDKSKKQGAPEKNLFKQPVPAPSCEGLFIIQENSSSNTFRNKMAPMHMTGIIKNDRKQEETMNNSSAFLSLSSEAVPPVWFTNYMETLKSDIVKEVSTKVMSDVMGVLNNGRPEVCPSCSHTPPRVRHSRETNNEDKQHRKKKKRVVEEVESSDAFSPPQQPDVPLLRKVKQIEKRERNLQRKLDHKLERLEQMTRIIVQTKNRCHDIAVIAKNFNKSCKLAEASAEPLVASALPQDKQTEEYDAVPNAAMPIEGRARMSCSVTGNEMLEKPIGKEIPYESESDSDNISIISAISNVSDLDADYNFEVIQTPACFILDKPLNNCAAVEGSKGKENGEKEAAISTEKQSFNVVCEAESDRNNNRDSPSYEILSGDASSASSIHLDEDHFHTSRNASEETGQHNDLIDLGNEDAAKGAALVIDPEGKIFEKKTETENENDRSNEMYLDKRAGGAYAFVNETLPSHGKDGSQMSKSETSFERSTAGAGADNAALSSSVKNSHHDSESKEAGEIPAANLSQSTSEPRVEVTSKIESTAESAQSFSSHISHSVGNSIYNFTEVQTRTSYTRPKYTVVDKNVSKGLEETKYSSGENNLGARGCQSRREEEEEEQINSDSRGKYQRGFTSESSACVFTEQPHKTGTSEGNSTRDSSPDFSRPNDSVHILPETLVSGAVNVASSAYSTARRVLDRIRNVQTAENNDHVENEVTLGSDVERYFTILEEMGFKNTNLNARLLSQFNYDMTRVISELVQ